jgi:hypothetical protein
VNTPQSAAQVCTHERRPGTTVCLHCRHAARIAAADRRKKLAFRGAALAIVAAVVSTAGLMSATKIRGRLAERGAVEQQPSASSTTPKADSASGTSLPILQQAATPPRDSGVRDTPVARSQPALTPVIAPGETILADSVIAVRTDSAVTLSFDKPMTRTRLPEKFERFLRRTLAEIYGAQIEGVLASQPEGSLTGQGNLLSELPTRGIHVPVSEDWKLIIYPETRPGLDGPLVIRYRVTVVAKK